MVTLDRSLRLPRSPNSLIIVPLYVCVTVCLRVCVLVCRTSRSFRVTGRARVRYVHEFSTSRGAPRECSVLHITVVVQDPPFRQMQIIIINQSRTIRIIVGEQQPKSVV